MRHWIYCMVDDEHYYDYDDETRTTDDIEVAYDWIRNGCKTVVRLDACDLAQHGYLDYEDLPEFKATLDECIDDFEEVA